MAESVKKRVPVGHTSSENWMEDKLRLNKKQFMVLLKKVKPHIVRRMAERFDPFSTLLEVLKFLATGEGENPSFKSILVVLCGALEAEYFPNFPETHDGWLEVAKDFETKWGVKRTVGAVTSDRVLCDPPKSCSAVYLDKETREHGLYIVTAVDAKYRIMFGGQGNFGSMKTPDFILNTLHLRVLESPFPKSNSKKNAYTMVADLQKGFKHRPWLHVRNDIMPEEYNEEIKRALKPGIIAHEILFSRFGVLSSNFKSSGEEFSCVIFMAVIALHNYFLATNPAYAPEYKDTKKWIDKKIEKIPRSISLNPREVGDEDEWMKKVFISKDIFQQFLNVLDSAKLGLDCDMDMPIRLKICLRFLVTGELYEPLTDVVVTAIDFLKCINLDFYRKIPLTFQGFKKKFQLDNCGGVVVTKRTSNYVPAENTDRLTMYVLVLTERGQIGLSIEVFEFDSSMSFTASAVESLLENMRHSEFLKSNKETRFIVGNNDMKNTDYLITPKAPGGQDRDTIMKVSEFGQKVLKKICSIFKVTKFSRKPSKFNPVFDRGTDLVFSTLHNWLVDNNPDYAKEFLTI